MRKSFAVFLAIVLSVSVLVPHSVLSHGGVTGIIKERMDAMSEMGKQTKSISGMFKGKSAVDVDFIATAAASYIEHGSRILSLFPDTEASRGGKKTEALPAIWARWSEFSELTEEFIRRSETLQSVTASTQDEATLKKAFLKTAKVCSGCHKKFRKPKRDR